LANFVVVLLHYGFAGRFNIWSCLKAKAFTMYGTLRGRGGGISTWPVFEN
jgi:hypothetical protein